MNKYGKLLLIAVQFCSIVLLTVLVAASASAQTSALALENDERADATDALASARRFRLPFVPSIPDPKPANSARTIIDRGIIKELTKAWHLSCNGQNAREGVVLIFRMEGGSYRGQTAGFTNEYRKFTFRWHPATVAIVHTHPNTSDPRPSEQDKRVADKYGIPNFTITISGMYMYDPATKKTSKVLNDLDWLDAVNLPRWAQEVVRGVDTSLHRVPES